MARDNDMGGGSLVPLALPPQHIPILRERLTTWLDGVREDLEAVDEAPRPDQAWQEARAFERLLTALATEDLSSRRSGKDGARGVGSCARPGERLCGRNRNSRCATCPA